MSKDGWEKAEERVSTEPAAYLHGCKEAHEDFIRWMFEEKEAEYEGLVAEWVKTKAGAEWLYHWTEQAYEDAQDPGENHHE